MERDLYVSSQTNMGSIALAHGYFSEALTRALANDEQA